MHAQDIESLQADFGGLRDESHEAGAVAISLGGMVIPDGRGGAFTMRIGHLRGESAISAHAGIRLPSESDLTVDFGVARGLRHSQTGLTAGFTWSW